MTNIANRKLPFIVGFPLKIVIFYSYVSLPKGIVCELENLRFKQLNQLWSVAIFQFAMWQIPEGNDDNGLMVYDKPGDDHGWDTIGWYNGDRMLEWLEWNVYGKYWYIMGIWWDRMGSLMGYFIG